MNAYLSKQINRELTKLISRSLDQYNFDQQIDSTYWTVEMCISLQAYVLILRQHGNDDDAPNVKATRLFYCINRNKMIMRCRKKSFLSILKASSDRFIPPCIALHEKSILLDSVTILKWHAGDGRLGRLFYFLFKFKLNFKIVSYLLT